MSGDKEVDPGRSPIDPLAKPIEAEVSVAFINVDGDGDVTGIDIYVVPKGEFDDMPSWATAGEYRHMCEQHRCIAVDTHFVREEGATEDDAG